MPFKLRTFLFSAALAAAVALAPSARAEPDTLGQGAAPSRAKTPAEQAPDPGPLVVRVAVTTRASEALSESRLRRLLDLQLGGAAAVAAEAQGSLDEQAIRVFIDLPSPTLTIIQVQAPGRRLDVRRLDISGLPWDAATRFVAIAASESVRLQMRPLPARRPRPPSDAEVTARMARTPSIEVTAAGLGSAILEAEEVTGLVGSRLRLSFHQQYLSEHLTLSVAASTAGGSYLEGGIGASHRMVPLPDLRLQFGAGFGLAAGMGISQQRGEVDPFVRAHGSLGLMARLGGPTWLTFDLEPGVVLDTRRAESAPMLLGAIGISLDGELATASVPAPASAKH